MDKELGDFSNLMPLKGSRKVDSFIRKALAHFVFFLRLFSLFSCLLFIDVEVTSSQKNSGSLGSPP